MGRIRWHIRSPAVLPAAFLAAWLAACQPVPPKAPVAEPPRRVVELNKELSFAAVVYRITIVDGPSRTSGSMRAESGDANRRGVEADLGCHMAEEPAASGIWGCDVPFRHPPNWSAVLARLDRLGIMAPPEDSLGPAQIGPVRTICSDGTPWSLVVRGPTGAVRVRDQPRCGARSPDRVRFETGLEALVDSLYAQARSG
jgi:hypothetical protein